MTTSRRRSREYSDGEDEEDEHHWSQGSVASGNKRIRMTKTEPGLASAKRERESLYAPGAIVRMRLKDFVTYDQVEFQPGPNLNMIIGPNGTGKSSLVCAIALGLAGKPDLLGRQKAAEEFIKDNKQKAYIEIELKGKGRSNVVITRCIGRGRSSSSWKINGNGASDKQVKEAVRELNVQVDNLCSFLPQDKVADFAKLDPPGLLRETERAAGDENLSIWHDELITLRNQEKEMHTSITDDQTQLEDLEKRNTILKAEVDRYEQRQTHKKRMRLLEKQIPWAKYAEVRARYLEVKQLRDQLAAQVEPMRRAHAALVEERHDMEKKLESLQQGVVKLTREVQAALVSDDGLQGKAEELNSAEQKAEDLINQIDAAKRREREKQRNLERLKAEITTTHAAIRKMESKLVEHGLIGEDGPADRPPQGEYAMLQHEIEDRNRRLREIGAQVDELERQSQGVDGEASTARRQREEIVQKLSSLDNVRLQRMATLQRADKDTYQAAQWINENTHRLKKPVVGPICMEISVKDPRYADAVEKGIGWKNLRTILAQCEEDYNTISEELYGRRKLRFNLAMFDHLQLSQYQPPFSRNELESLGLDDVILNLIDAPEAIKTALCAQANIHGKPVARDGSRIDLDMMERFGRIGNFCAGDTQYVIRNAYGSTSTTASLIGRATYLGQSVDMDRKRQLEAHLEAANQKLTECEGRKKGVVLQITKLRTQEENLRNEKARFTERKKELAQLQQQYQLMKNKLDLKQRELEQKEADHTSREEEEANLRAQLLSTYETKAKLALAYKKKARAAMDLFYQRTVASLRQLEHQAKLNDFIAMIEEKHQAFAELESQARQLHEQVRELKTQARKSLDLAQNGVADLTEEEKTALQAEFAGKTADDLGNELLTERTRSEMINSTDASVIADYRRRQAEIERLKAKVSSHEGRLSSLRQNMQRLRDQWIPELQSLIQRLSTNFATAFDKIGCAGEVRISENEDYDQWGIEILVKFRDNERLQPLTGTRQSGGERAVSTILYLMSLQALSHTPFRVVDEINQGMDPRNERMVHGEMVRAACQEGTSQYFLITPKLLSDLEYHERMRVLCVFNGPYLPDENLDPRKYIGRI
ncbi:P-loop containing nucleoside triphosphate hydrolase protein [Gaertneriomyces semiglobifer]|nr:P-loop containing nucleoside triphosphate hydrolase protein [Gaertneriomyces semiglobifer]